jgi:hypothetical protein
MVQAGQSLKQVLSPERPEQKELGDGLSSRAPAKQV